MFDHLIAFRQIRKANDEKYPEVFDEPTRLLMQSLKPVDSIKGNPSMRHKCGASQRFISRVAEHTNPHSKTLTSLNDFFTSIQPDSSSNSDTLLVNLDRRLGGLAQEMANRGSGGAVPSKERMQHEVASLLDLDGWSSTLDGEELDVLIEKHPNGSQIKVFVKLGLLAMKRAAHPLTDVRDTFADLKSRVTAATLWPAIVAHTDELYCEAEQYEEITKKVVHELLIEAGLNPEQYPERISHGDLKDPVRVHEKAWDDYRNNFDDDVIPEACVLDVIRTRIVCPEGHNKLLLDPVGVISLVDVDLGDGRHARLEVVRNKNKFKEGDEGPTHFRNMLLNCRLLFSSKDGPPEPVFFTEMQLHNQTLLEHNDQMDSHRHYNYFRAWLQDSYESELDAMLHKVMETFDIVLKTPVLLSLLILTLDDATSCLPSDLLELYIAAFAATMKRHGVQKPDSVLQMLRQVACSNMFQPSAKGKQQMKREFSSQDMRTIFEQDDSHLADWDALVRDQQGVPLVKTLSCGKDDVFQFMHLSFQEALFASELIQNPDVVLSFWGSDATALQRLESQLYRNTFVVGGCRLGEALALHRPCWCFRGEDLSKNEFRAFDSICLLFSSILTELDVSSCSIGDKGAQSLARALKHNSSVTKVSH